MQGIEIFDEGQSLLVKLSGEIDSGNAQEFFSVVMDGFMKDPKDVIFDCAELEFIDSTTLGTFVKILKRVKSSGKNMKLASLQAKIKRLFTICALDKIMELE